MSKHSCPLPHCPVCDGHVQGMRSSGAKPVYDGPDFEVIHCMEHGVHYIPASGDAIGFRPADLATLPARLGVTASVGFWVAYMAGLLLKQVSQEEQRHKMQLSIARAPDVPDDVVAAFAKALGFEVQPGDGEKPKN